MTQPAQEMKQEVVARLALAMDYSRTPEERAEHARLAAYICSRLAERMKDNDWEGVYHA